MSRRLSCTWEGREGKGVGNGKGETGAWSGEWGGFVWKTCVSGRGGYNVLIERSAPEESCCFMCFCVYLSV